MRQVLFNPGGGEGAHDAWDVKLVNSLRRKLGEAFVIFYPRMPNEADPVYGSWSAAIEWESATLGDGAILVGHSIGGTILINALATDPPERALGGVFLIAAPFIGDGGWSSDDIIPRSKLRDDLPDGVPIYLYHGSGDETAPVAHLDLYAKAIPQAVTRRRKVGTISWTTTLARLRGTSKRCRDAGSGMPVQLRSRQLPNAPIVTRVTGARSCR